jgi:hypothetical protein
MRLFLEFVDGDRSVLEDGYLRRWHTAAVRAGTSTNHKFDFGSRDENVA